jgi:xylan 1,4-beta-xylosidase
VKVTSSGSLASDAIVHDGVRARPDINAIATRKEREIDILVWNYHDDDVLFPAATIDVAITGLPANANRGLLEHFHVDSHHSNSFAAWMEMGSQQSPSAIELDSLQNAGQLQLQSSPAWIDIPHGEMHLQFTLPRQGLSLLRLAW